MSLTSDEPIRRSSLLNPRSHSGSELRQPRCVQDGGLEPRLAVARASADRATRQRLRRVRPRRQPARRRTPVVGDGCDGQAPAGRSRDGLGRPARARRPRWARLRSRASTGRNRPPPGWVGLLVTPESSATGAAARRTCWRSPRRHAARSCCSRRCTRRCRASSVRRRRSCTA